MSVNSIDFNWKVKKLEIGYKIKPFSSGDDDLDDFLMHDAENYLAHKLAITYLLETRANTIAYFCLSNDSIRRDVDLKTWNRINRSIPNSKRKGNYPAVKIGRLAVNKKYTDLGFGTIIIEFVKSLYSENFNERSAGCRFITVDAYGTATGFYEKQGFRMFTEKDEGKATRIMYFDMAE